MKENQKISTNKIELPNHTKEQVDDLVKKQNQANIRLNLLKQGLSEEVIEERMVEIENHLKTIRERGNQ